MSKRKLSFLVLAMVVVGAMVPVLVGPKPAEAVRTDGTWRSWIPNHPAGCAGYPFDCFVPVDVFTPTGPRPGN